MSIKDEAWNTLPYCNICLGSTDPHYLAYNIAVSGVVLALVGIVGLLGNVLVVIVYTSDEQRIHSTSIYLAALAVSDFFMITTAMFLFVLEAWRHHGPLTLAYTYGLGAPLIFPLGAIFQTTSVYFCVAVAVDCFISVVLPRTFKEICCTAKNAKIVVFFLVMLCFFYNIPHFFELRAVECLQKITESSDLSSPSIKENINYRSLQICPTDIRLDALYYTVYYTYMYTTFMAVGPLILLIVLNIFVVISVIRKGPSSEDCDIVSLILVVFLFILCNLTALVVNFLELTLYDKLKYIIVYLVDLSNLLVIINATANFFVYLMFGDSFRRSLMTIYSNRNRKLRMTDGIVSSLLWAKKKTTFMTEKLSSPSVNITPTPSRSATQFQLEESIENKDLKRILSTEII